MSEIFNAIKLKNKIAIASSMAVFAVLLATVIGVLTFATADTHTHVYDYSLEMEEDGSFNLVGVCKVDNCENPYYRENNLSGVRILSAESPTCQKSGNRVYTYTHGGVTVKYTEELPMTAHSYDYELGSLNGVNYLNGRCTADGCDNAIFINNIENIRLVSAVEGTCFSPRKETYVYTVDGEEHTFTTLVEEDIPHTLNGVSANVFKNDDGKYPVGIPGIKIFENKKLACGATADGYYICEVCKEIVPVKVVRPDHLFIYSEENVIEPTLKNAGKATLICHNTECTEIKEVTLPPVMNGDELGYYSSVESEATEAHPQIVKYEYTDLSNVFTFVQLYEVGEPLSHNYQYFLVPGNHGNGQFDLLEKCDQKDCQTPEIRIENVPAVFVRDESTCQTPGVVTWSYEYKGQYIEFSALSEKTSDHNYEYDKNKAIHPSFTSAGLIELYCSTEGCNHTVIVELPKVVIGENTVYVGDTEIGGTIYLYSYQTEYNCTVVLNIIDYKEE